MITGDKTRHARDVHVSALLVVSALGCASARAPVTPPRPTPAHLDCTYTYAGETKTLRVDATVDPYRVPAIAVGDPFSLKIVYVNAPADIASVRVYTARPLPNGALPLHEAKFRPPYSVGGEHGFTGLQLVYEPNGAELAYFCAWVPG